MKSLFEKLNNQDCVWKDKAGNILTGTNIVPGDIFGYDFNLIVRLNDKGLLHSEQQPAVEAPGHLEYWLDGKLHRSNNLPAVSAEGFKYNEIWENGKLVSKDY